MLVNRNNEIINIPITSEFVADAIKSKSPWMTPRIPYFVKGFTDDSPAEIAGLVPGDKIISFNGASMLYFDQYIQEIPKYANKEITLGVLRSDMILFFNFTVAENGQMGVYYKNDLSQIFPLKTIKYQPYVSKFVLLPRPVATWEELNFRYSFDAPAVGAGQPRPAPSPRKLSNP